MLRKLFPILALAILATMMAGCFHYRLGDGNKPKYHTIAFAPVINNSFAPQMQALVSDALFRSFARGGGMAVESQGSNAEVMLHVTIGEFHKMMGATNTSDTGRARSLVMVIKANAVLTDASGQTVYNQDFTVTQEFYADSGMERAENEAMPQLADLLSQKIYRAVVSNW